MKQNILIFGVYPAMMGSKVSFSEKRKIDKSNIEKYKE